MAAWLYLHYGNHASTVILQICTPKLWKNGYTVPPFWKSKLGRTDHTSNLATKMPLAELDFISGNLTTLAQTFLQSGTQSLWKWLHFQYRNPYSVRIHLIWKPGKRQEWTYLQSGNQKWERMTVPPFWKLTLGENYCTSSLEAQNRARMDIGSNLETKNGHEWKPLNGVINICDLKIKQGHHICKSWYADIWEWE